MSSQEWCKFFFSDVAVGIPQYPEERKHSFINKHSSGVVRFGADGNKGYQSSIHAAPPSKDRGSGDMEGMSSRLPPKLFRMIQYGQSKFRSVRCFKLECIGYGFHHHSIAAARKMWNRRNKMTLITRNFPSHKTIQRLICIATYSGLLGEKYFAFISVIWNV